MVFHRLPHTESELSAWRVSFFSAWRVFDAQLRHQATAFWRPSKALLTSETSPGNMGSSFQQET